MKRLFAFGCSYTAYMWSTWADIIGAGYDEYQNWGLTGAGNFYMFASVMEAHQRHRLTADDTVIVCWTNVTREDRYVGPGWRNLGNMYTQTLVDQKWVRENISERGCMIRDLACMSATTHFLRSVGVDWKYISMVPILQTDQYNPEPMPDFEVRDVLDCYADVIELIRPSYQQVLVNRKPLTFDMHPSPQDHLDYVDQVLPEYTVLPETRLQIAEEERIVRAMTASNRQYKNYNIARL